MTTAPTQAGSLALQELLKQYEYGLDVTFPSDPHAAYERRLVFDHVVMPAASDLCQRFEALEKWPVRLFEEEHFFLFGLTVEQVLSSRGWYNPHWNYEHEPETKRALDMIAANVFSQSEPGIFTPIWDVLLMHGDYYMHLADLSAYVQTQERVGALYRQPTAWARQAILNVGHAGKFSSDLTIAAYAADIWQALPCPVQ